MPGGQGRKRPASDRRNTSTGGSGLVGSIPILSGPEVVRVFELLGWSVARRRGNHIVMVKAGEIATLSVPDHKRGD